MRKLLVLAALAVVIVSVTGCGGSERNAADIGEQLTKEMSADSVLLGAKVNCSEYGLAERAGEREMLYNCSVRRPGASWISMCVFYADGKIWTAREVGETCE